MLVAINRRLTEATESSSFRLRYYQDLKTELYYVRESLRIRFDHRIADRSRILAPIISARSSTSKVGECKGGQPLACEQQPKRNKQPGMS